MFKKISLWYALVLFLCFIVYPWWLLLDSFPQVLISVNALLLLIWGGYYFLKKIFKDAEVVISLPSRRQFLLMLLFFLLLLGIHAYALSFPIQPSDDEHFHASKGVYLAQSMRLVFSYIIGNYLLLFLFSLLLLFLLGYLIMRNKNFIQDHWKKSKLFSKVVLIFCGILLINCYVFSVHLLFQKIGLAVFGFSVSSSSLGWLIRFPPLGTMINGFVSLLGFQEVFLVRTVQIIFIFLAAYYLHKIISLYLSKELAVFSSMLFLFTPGIFYFSNLAFMTGGELFFLAITSYHFIKYMQVYITQGKHSVSDLWLLFLFTLIGFFYKEPILFILPVFIASLVFEYANKNQWQWQEIKQILKEFKRFWLLTTMTVVFAGIWIMIRSTFFDLTNSQQQYLVISNLLSIDRWISYIELVPEMLTWPIIILMLLSILYFLILKCKDLFMSKSLLIIRFSLLYIIIFISTYVTYNWQEAVLRFLVTIIPPIVIVISIFVHSTIESLFTRRVIVGILVVAIITQSSIMTYKDIEDRYWRYDELYRYMSHNLSSDEKVLFIVQHMDFYRISNNMKTTIIPLQEIPNNTLNSQEDFMKFLDNNEITHVVFADSNNLIYTTTSFTKPDRNSEKFYNKTSMFFQNLSNTSNRFAIEKEFGKQRNKLLLAKIQKT